MAYTATKNASGTYDIFNNGQKISTGSSAVLGNYGLSESSLGSSGGSPSMGVTTKPPESNITRTSTSLPSTQSNPQPVYSSTGGAIIPQANVASQQYTPPPPIHYTTDRAQNAKINESIGYTPPTQTTQTNATPTVPMGGGYGQQGSQSQMQSPYYPSSGLYGQLVSGLANTSQTGNPALGGIMNSLINTSTTNPLTSGGAYDTYSKAVQDLSSFKQKLAEQYGNLGSQAIPLNFQQGRKQVLQTQSASQLDALQQAVTQAQQALGYGISEQQAQQSGLNSAGNLANASQGLIQSGLASAAGYAQPSGAFPFVFNPVTGQFTSSGGATGSTTTPTFNPQTDSLNFGQAVIKGQMTYQQALSALSYVGQTASSYLNSAITSQGGNPLALEAQGAATQGNIQTAGSAQTGAANTAYQQAYSQAIETNQALNQVDSLGSLVLQTAQGGNINPFNVQAGNITVAELKRQLSSPAQAQFDQSMATFQGALSQLLSGSSSVTPTTLSQWSTQISNGTMPVQTLQAIFAQAKKEGALKLNNILQTASAAYQQLQGSTNTNAQPNQPAGWL